jgi:SAM-dependent methyltransferase
VTPDARGGRSRASRRAVARARFRSALACCLAAHLFLAPLATADPPLAARRITWADVTPFAEALAARGLDASNFPAHVEQVHQSNALRVHEGDLDHLVFYLLQSTRFTPLPPIEPALSARALVEGLTAAQREAFLAKGQADIAQVAGPVRARAAALLRALDARSDDTRLTFFRSLVNSTFPDRRAREDGLLREYLRAMRFLYQKEFIAQRAGRPAEAVAELYRTRGLSTDTAVEAGYAASIGLGVVASLRSGERIRRVLIVGPGLDLAPRTGLLETGPPESYQPWAVIDALVALGLSRLDDLTVVAADINPRVVEHLQRARTTPPLLTLSSEIRENDNITLAPAYREYFGRVGDAIGQVLPAAAGTTRRPGDPGPTLQKRLRVTSAAARVLAATQLDIVSDRLEGEPFDLIVATNILPYFDDPGLMLAMSNIAGMLAPGGVFLHNESRAALQEISRAVGLPFQQSRQVIIATVRGAAAPLFDSVYLHVKGEARR